MACCEECASGQSCASLSDGPAAPPDRIVLIETPSDLYAITAGPGGHDPTVLDALDIHSGALGGFWSSIGGFFKKIGSGIWSVVRRAKDNPQIREGIARWLQEQGGAEAVRERACIFDPICGAYYILDGATDESASFRLAGQGECVGRRTYDATQVNGWVTPPACTSAAPIGGGSPIGVGVGAGAGGVTAWLNSNWRGIAIVGGGVAGLMVLSSLLGGRRKRRF